MPRITDDAAYPALAALTDDGAIAPLDSIWIAKAPFEAPILLESFPSVNTLGTIGDPVESGDYVFFGTYRCKKPALL